jgi:hypothetical protein
VLVAKSQQAVHVHRYAFWQERIDELTGQVAATQASCAAAQGEAALLRSRELQQSALVAEERNRSASALAAIQEVHAAEIAARQQQHASSLSALRTQHMADATAAASVADDLRRHLDEERARGAQAVAAA